MSTANTDTKGRPPATADMSLELSGDQLRQMVDQAMDHIVDHIDSLPDQPAWSSDNAAELARSMDEPLPNKGVPFGDVLHDLFEKCFQQTFNTASPGYLAFIPGGGVLHSAVADLIANAVNRYMGVWIAAPALSQLESTVVRWFCDMVGYPSEAGGFLTTGGSLANWSAIVTARRCRLPEDFRSATIYTSSQAHHSVQKAAMLAGFPAGNVRKIDVDEKFRMQLDDLAKQIEMDRNAGMTPFAVVGSAGTTNTGAIDNIDALADIAAKENLWLHVDAAYGGFFMLTERGRAAMKGIERADSITLDPHKGLFLPYGNGCLLMRRLEDLRHAHSLHADYLPAPQEDSQFVDFNDISPELSRDCRGLRAWLPIKLCGIDAFRNNLDEKLDLTQFVLEELRRINSQIDDELEIIAEPQLSVVVFRLRRKGLDEAELTLLNQKFRKKINASRRVYLTPTILSGRYVIRICILSFRTHMDRVEECLQEIRNAIE